MQRTIGSVMIASGAALLMLAPLLAWWIGPSLMVAPANQFSVTVSEAKNATYFSVADLEVKTGAHMRATRRVRGDVAGAVSSGSNDVAVYEVFTRVEHLNSTGNTPVQLVSADVDRVAFDKRTSQAVACCQEGIDGKQVRHSGISYKFPFRAGQRDYDYFDTSTKKTHVMKFLGVEVFDDVPEASGMALHKYRQTIKPTKIAETEVPGKLVGQSGKDSVLTDRMFSVVRTVWVEPVSGIIVRGSEQQYATLRDPKSGKDLLVITDMLMQWTDATIRDQAANAHGVRSKIVMATRIAPTALGIGGAGLAAAGVYMFWFSSSASRRKARAAPSPVAYV